MRCQITPEPTPEEWDILLRALAVQDGVAAEPSAWWQAGTAAGDSDDDWATSSESPPGLSAT